MIFLIYADNAIVMSCHK